MSPEDCDKIDRDTAVDLYRAYHAGMFGNVGITTSLYQLQRLIHNLNQSLIAVNTRKGKFKAKEFIDFCDLYPEFNANLMMRENSDEPKNVLGLNMLLKVKRDLNKP